MRKGIILKGLKSFAFLKKNKKVCLGQVFILRDFKSFMFVGWGVKQKQEKMGKFGEQKPSSKVFLVVHIVSWAISTMK
jgi:hypothetical protein